MFKFSTRGVSEKSAGQRKNRVLAAACKPVFENLEERRFFSFTGSAMLPTGMSVTSVATADFNNDGLADIVSVGNLSGRGIAAVQLNNGDGTFSPPHSSNTGNNPVEVQVGDFDGDGNDDVVTLASYYTGALTVLKGNGDGSFKPAESYTVQTPPTSIQVEDINHDGKPDLIAGNHYFNSVSVFKNNGLGMLNPKVDYAGGGSPASVGIADFNNDGNPDILSTNELSTGSITLNLGNGDGTFGAAKNIGTTASPTVNTIADFNGDGNMDVAIANTFGSNVVSVLFGNGDGTFQSPKTLAVGTQVLDVQHGDVNGDTKPDLIERTGSGFAVELNNGDGTFSAASLIQASVSNDMVVADFNKDGYADVALSSSGGNVSIYTNDLGSIDAAQNVGNLVISAPTTTMSGVPIAVTLYVVDDAGNPITDYAGNVSIFSTDPSGSVINYTFTAADSGTHTFDPGISLISIGTQSIIATGAQLNSASANVQVQAAPASRFAVSLSNEDVQAGTPMTFTVTALDSSNNMGASYLGTVHFTSSDPLANLPADYTFTAVDAGTHSFSVSMFTAGLQTVTATDTVMTNVRGTSNAITIEAEAPSTMLVTGGSGSIGKFRTVHVDLEDEFGNHSVGATTARTIHFTSSDPAAVLPADVTMVNGSADVQVKFMTVGTQTITATDVNAPAVSGTETITATPADVGSFVVSGFPATVAGTAKTFTVSAIDVLGNAMPNYTGTISFSSSDFQAALPAAYTFTAADGGVHTFSATLKTAGSQSISVRESLFLASGSQSGIAVTPAAVSQITSTAPQHVVAGIAFPMMITARDAFGNLATNFTDKVRFSATDTQAVLPADYTFTAADQGIHTFNIVFKTATNTQTGWSVTAADSNNSKILTTVAGIEVFNNIATSFTLAVPSQATVGTPFSVKLSVLDAYGNKVKNYYGTVHFTNSVAGAVLPADYTFNGTEAGVASFNVTMNSTATQTLTVVDLANSTLTAKGTITPRTSGGGGGGGGGGGSGSGKTV